MLSRSVHVKSVYKQVDEIDPRNSLYEETLRNIHSAFIFLTKCLKCENKNAIIMIVEVATLFLLRSIIVE